MELQKTIESALEQVFNDSKSYVTLQGANFTQEEVIQTLENMHWKQLASFKRTKGEWTYHYKKDNKHLVVDTMYCGNLMILHCNYRPTANIDNLISKKIEMLFNNKLERVLLPKYLVPNDIKNCLKRLGWYFEEVLDRDYDNVYYLFAKCGKGLVFYYNGLTCEYEFYEYEY